MKKQDLLNYLDDDLLDKLFGFCYARTSGGYEAEEDHLRLGEEDLVRVQKTVAFDLLFELGVAAVFFLRDFEARILRGVFEKHSERYEYEEHRDHRETECGAPAPFGIQFKAKENRKIGYDLCHAALCIRRIEVSNNAIVCSATA